MNNKRLLKVLSFINKDDKIVDVGCDHAYLSKMLAERNQASIASDCVKSIIEEREKEPHSPLIKYYLSNGLKDIPPNEYDYPVICGMGTFTILNILTKSNINFNKCLILSHSKYKDLRVGMQKLGFIVDFEEVVKDNNRFYNIIMFKKGKINYTEKELYIGVNHKNTELLEEKNKYLKNKYLKIKHKLPETSEILIELKYL